MERIDDEYIKPVPILPLILSKEGIRLWKELMEREYNKGRDRFSAENDTEI